MEGRELCFSNSFGFLSFHHCEWVTMYACAYLRAFIMWNGCTSIAPLALPFPFRSCCTSSWILVSQRNVEQDSGYLTRNVVLTRAMLGKYWIWSRASVQEKERLNENNQSRRIRPWSWVPTFNSHYIWIVWTDPCRREPFPYFLLFLASVFLYNVRSDKKMTLSSLSDSAS